MAARRGFHREGDRDTGCGRGQELGVGPVEGASCWDRRQKAIEKLARDWAMWRNARIRLHFFKKRNEMQE